MGLTIPEILAGLAAAFMSNFAATINAAPSLCASERIARHR